MWLTFEAEYVVVDASEFPAAGGRRLKYAEAACEGMGPLLARDRRGRSNAAESDVVESLTIGVRGARRLAADDKGPLGDDRGSGERRRWRANFCEAPRRAPHVPWRRGARDGKRPRDGEAVLEAVHEEVHVHAGDAGKERQDEGGVEATGPGGREDGAGMRAADPPQGYPSMPSSSSGEGGRTRSECEATHFMSAVLRCAEVALAGETAGGGRDGVADRVEVGGGDVVAHREAVLARAWAG